MTRKLNEKTIKKNKNLLKRALDNGLDLTLVDTMSKSALESILKTKKLKQSTFKNYINTFKRFRDNNEFFEQTAKNITGKSSVYKINQDLHEYRRILHQTFVNIPFFSLKYHTHIELIPTTLPNGLKSKVLLRCNHSIGQKNWNSIRNQKESNLWFALECVKQDINLIMRHDIMKNEKIIKNVGFTVYIQTIDIKTRKTGYSTVAQQTGLTYGLKTIKDRIKTKMLELIKSMNSVGRSVLYRIYTTNIDLMFYE